MDKYSWLELIYNNIDWTAHYASIKKSSMPHKFIIKFIHGWLPIGNMTHRYHTKYNAKCPSCSHNPEDINHFLQCPTCREWKTSLFARLAQFFSHTLTQPALADLLQECLRQWLHTNSPIFLNPSPQHTKLLTQQAQRIKCSKVSFQSNGKPFNCNYISWRRNLPDGYSAQTWLCGIILIIWEHVHKNWISHNEDQHSHDTQSWEEHKYAQPRHETSDLYCQ